MTISIQTAESYEKVLIEQIRFHQIQKEAATTAKKEGRIDRETWHERFYRHDAIIKALREVARIDRHAFWLRVWEEDAAKSGV